MQKLDLKPLAQAWKEPEQEPDLLEAEEVPPEAVAQKSTSKVVPISTSRTR